MSTLALLRSGLALALSILVMPVASHAAEIVRDKFGVPHVYGVDVADAFFGYGYAAAEDRLFQLEMRRRQATGQLAAVLGPLGKSAATGATVRLVELDQQTRAEYDPASLRRQFDTLQPEEQKLILGYLGGLNLRIQEVTRGNGSMLPPQFREVWGDALARKELKPWTLDDMLAAASNALTSYSSFTTSQQNAELYAKLKKKYPEDFQKVFDTLLWTHDPYAPTTREDHAVLALASPPEPIRLAGGKPAATIHGVPVSSSEDMPQETNTSMAVLVGKTKTAGVSIQLNGPQPGWFVPGYFYTVGLHAPGYDVVGHAPGGLLAITTGDNGHIAWGSTSAGGDHTTIYEERMSADRRQYRFQGQDREVRSEKVLIEVKDSAPVEVTINRTHRGPFITPLDAPVVYSKHNLWKGHELSSVMAWQRATQTRTWDAFHAEGRLMAMGYNWFFSDKSGNIGWLFGGFFPGDLSNTAGDPRLPAVGERGDVVGRSYANEVFLYNPPSGYLVNWNNKPQQGYANRDLHTPRWSQGDRANILSDLMRQRASQDRPITEDDVRQMYQRATTTDVNFHHFGPLLRRTDPQLAGRMDKETQQALAILQAWDGARLPDPAGTFYAGAAVPIFQAWLDQFVGMTVGTLLTRDEFSSMPMYTGTLQFNFMKNSVNLSMGAKIALRGLQARMGLRPDALPAFDVLRGKEPQQLMLDALQAAVQTLKKTTPGTVDSWRLPMIRQTFFPENFESVQTASKSDMRSLPVSANRGVMQRLAVGNGTQIQSMDANPPGTSADPRSPHFDDQLPLYGQWGFKPMPLSPQKTGAGKVVSASTGSKL